MIFIEIIEKGKDLFLINFMSSKKFSVDILQIKINTIFTFTLPITLAIFISLIPYLERRKRAIVEALTILISIHILYVFSHELYEITKFLISKNIEPLKKMPFYFYQYFSLFTREMIIRFEPFLVGLYIYLRFKRKQLLKKHHNPPFCISSY